MPPSLPTSLFVLSGVGFIVGLWFPIQVLLDPGPSAMAYGIILVSFPAWGAGALTGGTAGYLLRRKPRGRPGLEILCWLMVGLNLAAVVICYLWSPEGVS